MASSWGQCSWQGHVAVRVVALERPAEEFGEFEAGQTAVLNPLKNRWQGHVAVRVVALEACCGVWRTAVLNPVKNRWQGHVAVRVVALEACCGVEAGQTAVLPWKGLQKRLEGLKPGKRQSWTPWKQMAGACRWLGHVADRVVALERRVPLLATRESLEPPEKQMAGAWRHGAGACSWQSCCLGKVCAFACDQIAKFHTSGGPRRRPCLGKGRGRRIYGRLLGVYILIFLNRKW